VLDFERHIIDRSERAEAFGDIFEAKRSGHGVNRQRLTVSVERSSQSARGGRLA
jgi:hypothetical protein